MILDYDLIGKRIQECRKLKNITQQTLAEKTDKSVPYISHIETAIKHPSLKTIFLIANALEVTVDQLLSGNQPHDKFAYYKEVSQLLDGCDSYERKIIFDVASATKDALRNYKYIQRR